MIAEAIVNLPDGERQAETGLLTDGLIDSPELARRIHEAIFRLSRRLRTLRLVGGLTSERLSTLGAIRMEGPISLSDLAGMEMVTLGTMSRMVSWLEAKNLVKRKAHKQDGRAILISTTAKGRRTHDRALAQSLTQIIETICELDSEELAAVATLLMDVRGTKS